VTCSGESARTTYLQEGWWEGTQLIPKQWVAEATSVQVSNAQGDVPDWRQGYGFQFWMSRHGYRGDGAFGQFCVILPEQDAVIVTTAYTLDMQAMLDAMWTHLLAGISTASPGTAFEAGELSARLARLELPASPGAPAPVNWEPWSQGPFSKAASMADTPAQPFIPSAGTSLTSVEVPLRTGGGLDDQTLRVEVIFLETPHRMDITCSLPGRTAHAVWRHPPITPSTLQDLHCPS
jgi:hypothetical protein